MSRIVIAICIVMLAPGLSAALPAKLGAGDQQRTIETKEIEGFGDKVWPSGPDPSHLTKPCEKGQDDRSSDLCAQWKAADSAYEAAVWSRRTGWFTGLGLIVGSITTVAAIAAAIFAKKAAGHARQSVEADRAWVSYSGSGVGPFVGAIGETQVSKGFALQIVFTNIGHTPARVSSFETGYGTLAYDDYPPEDFETNGLDHASLVPNGQTLRIGRLLNDEETRKFRAKELAVWLYARIIYEDIYSPAEAPTTRETECMIRVRHRGGKQGWPQPDIEDVAFDPIGPRNRMT